MSELTLADPEHIGTCGILDIGELETCDSSDWGRRRRRAVCRSGRAGGAEHCLAAGHCAAGRGAPGGAAAVTLTRDIVPDLRIIALAVRETEEDIIAWAEAGVIGYVPSTAVVADLVRLVMNIHKGDQSCSGPVAAALVRRSAED